VLRPLLPSLGNLIHDKAEKVRLAAVKLLRQIKQTPGIHFYHVVPVDHLSARFSEEEKAHRDPRNSVNKELTALMLSSYFPQGRNISAADQMQRTMTFLMTDPSAASSFYANLADFLEVESVAKFIVMLLACLKSAVQTEESQQVQNSEKGKKRRRYGSNNNNASEKDEQGLSASNTALMVGLTETMSTLLESIDESLTLPDNGPSKKLLAERLREANLVNILAHFEQKALDTQSSGSSEKREDNFRVCRAILRCASCMPKDTMTGISEFVVDSLEAIANDGSIPSIHVSTHLSLLANWGMIEEIATSLAASVVSAIDAAMGMRLLSPCSTSISRSRKSRGKGRQDKNKLKLPDFSPKFASNAIDDMLSGSSASALALREHLFASSKASQTIEEALIKAMDFTERVLDSQSVSNCFVHLLGYCQRIVLTLLFAWRR
jgi:condensin-2 complex subunit G2